MVKDDDKMFEYSVDPRLQMGNIVQHLRMHSQMHEETQKYFYRKSKCWNAIRDHIANAKDCVLIKRKDHVLCHRGTGAAVRFQKAIAFHWEYSGKDRTERDYYILRFRVEFITEHDDEYSKEFELLVPNDLEINFSDNKFKLWIAQKKKERDTKKEAKASKKLIKLIKKYPKMAASLIK